MQRFRVRTLVDITRTNIFKESLGLLEKKQQDNFQTLHQTLEMRAIIFTDTDPRIEIMDWKEFGYSDKEKTWVWDFYTERDDLFLLDDDPCGGMKHDIEYVPFVIDCTESAKFKANFFSSKLKPVNILFELNNK